MLLSEEDVVEAVRRSLREWGIKSKRSEEERQFYNNAIETALSIFNQTNVRTDVDPKKGDNENNKLPSTLINAFKHILSTEINGFSRFSIAYDLLDLGEREYPNISCNRPYYIDRKSDKLCKDKKFEPFREKQLRPLERFLQVRLPPSLFHFNNFSMESSVLGMAFEAAVAHHAEHTKQKCLNCKKEGTLVWYGGSSTSSAWRDMICQSCHSTYEIKSKASTEAIEKAFHYNETRGGSYALFQKLISETKSLPRNQRGKQYIVFVSREAIFPKKGHSYWSVEAAEIDYILPDLGYNSFFDTKKISFKSKIVAKQITRTLWFKVKALEIDWIKVARSIYQKHYPDIDWNSGDEEIEKIVNETHMKKKKNGGQQKEERIEENVNENKSHIEENVKEKELLQIEDTTVVREELDYETKLQEELEAMKVDDWEDLEL